jgi:hypothetical protein
MILYSIVTITVIFNLVLILTHKDKPVQPARVVAHTHENRRIKR